MRISRPGTGRPSRGSLRVVDKSGSAGLATLSVSRAARSTASQTSPRMGGGKLPPIATSAMPKAQNSAPGRNPWGTAEATKFSTATGSTGSAPFRAMRIGDRSRRSPLSFILFRARLARTQEKFGPAVMVPRYSLIQRIQSAGRFMKSRGEARSREQPTVMETVSSPMSPIS